jgi:hypothetical protein
MRDCSWVAILQWFLSLDHIPALHTLYVRGGYRHQGDTSTLSTFLLGSQLKELWLDPDVRGGVFFVILPKSAGTHASQT